MCGRGAGSAALRLIVTVIVMMIVAALPLVTKAAAPQRIISLVPSLTESVCALQLCERLVGVDRHSNWPGRVQALPKLGGLDDVQLERVVALKPDLVLAAPSARIVPRLRSLGVNVVVLNPQTQAEIERTFRELGKRLEAEPAAEQAIEKIQAQIQQAQQLVPAWVKAQRVYFEVASTPFAAGPASFIGELMQRLGLHNIIPPELGVFPQINPEFVVRQQPQIILIAQNAQAGLAQRPAWASLPALKQQQICAFPAAEYDILVRPGPRLGEAALLMARCLQRFTQSASSSNH
ncbi:ABC transporter substrate-binding protein [Parvibium lacunae]|uniref:ABC transporter substrate-binding protein n=2 Tax=Parvibium lacunae TaxID=1888893 RepID=A0A368L6F4_9BURK|nr:ABC transporter substrate-binding protein [Parvibium lacunae]